MPSIADLRAAITSAPMSVVLIAVNLAVFIAATIDGRLMDVLALPPDWARLLEQPWTVVTVFFTAEVPIHIFAAVFIIGLFGTRFERIAGSRHALGVYLLAGLVGSLALVATAVATGFDEPSNGASAAFFGLMAVLAACSREAWGPKLHVEKVLAVVVVTQLDPPVPTASPASMRSACCEHRGEYPVERFDFTTTGARDRRGWGAAVERSRRCGRCARPGLRGRTRQPRPASRSGDASEGPADRNPPRAGLDDAARVGPRGHDRWGDRRGRHLAASGT